LNVTMVWLTVVIVVLVVLFIIFAAYWAVLAHRRKVVGGKEELIGKTAVVETALEPRGVVQVEGELWTATLDKGTAEPEEEVVITKVEGLKLTVTRKV
jgi:membrane protein implicated in regulation of membrane protease activity